MREVEIKARVKDPDRLFEAISSEGVRLPESISQNDSIFVLKPFRLSEIKKGSSPILRIREERNKCTFTLKKDITDQLDSIEHEIEINDVGEMTAILNELGYHKVLEVRKIRRKFKFNDYSVCVDEVERLGTFIELESKVDGNVDVEAVRAKMWNVLNKFNISLDNQVTKGYDRLLDEI